MALRFWVPSLYVLTFVILSACDTSGDQKASLRIQKPSAEAVITRADDLDPARPGIQVNVEVVSDLLGFDEEVQLFLDGALAGTAKPGEGGLVAFSGLSLSGGRHRLQAKARQGKVESEFTNVTVDEGTDVPGGPGDPGDPGNTQPSVQITSPVAGAVLGPGTADCDTTESGLQIAVSATTDAEDGSVATAQVGTSPRSPSVTVSAGSVTLCVTAAEGTDIPLVVTVTDTTGDVGSSTINITVDFPALTAPVDSLSLVGIVDNRTSRVRFSWRIVGDSRGNALTDYVIKCDDPSASTAAAPIDSEEDWAAAESQAVINLSGPLTVGENTTREVDLPDVRMKDLRRCAIRGRNAALQLTPLPATDASIDVLVDFNVVSIPVPSGARRFGYAVAPVGDVNGDGRADFLVGSDGSGAYLYFGRAAWGTNVQPDVHFKATATFAGTRTGLEASCDPDFFNPRDDQNNFGLGYALTGIGDFNGDGISDFAIADVTYPSCTFDGMVYVIYGKTAGSPWPSSVDLAPPSCTNPATCCGVGNGICLLAVDPGFSFGTSVASAGNFDGAVGPANRQTFELAVGATELFSNPGNVVVIRHSASYPNGGVVPVSANAAANAAEGFLIDVPTLTDNQAQLGFSVVWGFNNTSGFPTLLTSAFGRGLVENAGRLYSVVGRTYDGPELDLVRDATLVDSGRGGDYGATVANLGAWSSATQNDIGVWLVRKATSGNARVYFRNMSNMTGLISPGAGACTAGVCTDVVSDGVTNSNMGLTMADAAHPAYGLLGDLDKDGFADAILGVHGFPSDRKGGALVIYGNANIRSQASQQGMQSKYRYFANENNTKDDLDRKTVNYIGDINGDGFADFAMGVYDNALSPLRSAPGLFVRY